MQDLLGVGELDRVGNIGDKLRCGFPLQGTLALDPVLQRPLHQGHQQIRLVSVGNTRVDHMHDSIVGRQQVERFAFALEPPTFFSRVRARAKQLHRHFPSRGENSCRENVRGSSGTNVHSW